MSGNSILNSAKYSSNNTDEWYTTYETIEDEIKHYTEQFYGKTVLCNCDDPFESNFCYFFMKNFNKLHLKKLICTSYSGSKIDQIKNNNQLTLDMFLEELKCSDGSHGYVLIITKMPGKSGEEVDDDTIKAMLSKKGVVKKLKGSGDFRTDECIEYLKQCDICCTNPPFSLFAELFSLVIKYKGTFEDSRQYTIRRFGVNGTTVERTVFPSDERNRYLHLYYSYSKAAAEREQLEQKIDKLAAYFKKLEGQPVVLDKSYEKYFSLEYYHEGQEDQCFVCAIEKSSVIEEELKMCGYFCIITSENMKAKEALELYKSRDVSEKLFKADKTFLGNRSMRVYTGDALEGKMLIAFVALIIRNRMYTKLKDEEEKLLSSPNFMNVPAAIRELEKIEMIRQADGVYRLDHAVTANQKIILKAFGIDANYIKRKAEQISNELNPKVLKVKINGRKS